MHAPLDAGVPVPVADTQVRKKIRSGRDVSGAPMLPPQSEPLAAVRPATKPGEGRALGITEGGYLGPVLSLLGWPSSDEHDTPRARVTERPRLRVKARAGQQRQPGFAGERG